MQFGDSTPLTPFPLLIGPEDASEGASASPWVSLENYGGGWVVINVGDLAGAASAVTLDQATDSSGTGTKTLGFTKYYQNGLKLAISGQSGTYVIGETLTGGTSLHTGKIIKISSDYLWITILTANSGTGTTWTTTETLTGTAGATATLTGTGSDEDMLLELTASSDTFDTLAITFKQYVIPVDNTMLDGDNDFSHFQLDMGDADASETQVCALFIPFNPRMMKYPQQTLIDAQKYA